ncbi:EAL domain-containing protein (putative c-di-GMP-specific phosphodiesterase class I) [Glaciihabitans tibetensis]|uniref:EAL domain-containing protein (Putative c-di-GMP-specific phosphodiesterase class I) n=1 Tax=Glaciihabitans tibetensis TaxID=1266600 RepID=A0A2T0VCW5_9MICO|nr:EAL domain-containing protein [Glaciihabitans tibetensis]PRY68029.1 EAL domain-containing protein (putative c-di-GMP-specific phosphodiesterase class I) [Glaciihabitans tibetensis]
MDLVPDLSQAVARGEIIAYFQPQVDAITRRVVAVEALARWRHPTLGLILPGVFIPLAEQYGLIADIGSFMIDEGCRCAAEWDDRGFGVQVAVNVSAAQLRTPAMLDHVAVRLRQHELPAAALVIEITESLPVIAIAEVCDRLNRMRSIGLGISVDDYGTGFSSMSQLMALPATEVKIDRSRVQGGTSSDAFITEVVEMARDRGLRVVAEGVETEEQLRVVRELGVDRVQGYLFGRPLPERDTVHLLEALT